MKNICFLILTCFVTIFLALCQNVQGESRALSEDQARTMQENLKKAMQELKREIKIEVKVENGGTITGSVKCKRIRYPENVVIFIEGGDKYVLN